MTSAGRPVALFSLSPSGNMAKNDAISVLKEPLTAVT